MSTALDLLKAKRSGVAAKQEEKRAASQLDQEQRERFFAPVRAVIEDLLKADPPIQFFTSSYLYGRERPLLIRP
jgi:hypothetical protein